ncbi:uncharacterized protein LOC132747841, partial [Ruditapes philippinarum]|uniref:uncharacterized protein LOC132747841 n=1 Tax=Ruditapes philippinarum TaxID=129788 RepID=UPI00295AC82F
MSVKKTFRRRDVVFLAFLFTIVHGILVFHEEKKSWWEAQSTCSQDGGTLVTTYTSADILRLTSAIETVWEGRYYSPWAWLIGCYSYNGSYDYIELKRNQLKKCLNHCNTTNYFGLQNKKCFCFDTFNGEFKRTEDNCIHECPGNSEERCGGPQALTVYMNDICYDNSREWQGTVSRTFTGKRCLPWANVTAMQTSSTIADYPDGPAENASNFCRDPTNKSFLWCYVSQDEIEQCDIPKCIAEDSVYPCMSFRKSGGIFYFTQENCDKTNAAVCETSDHKHLLDRNIRTWSDARDQNRHAYYRDSGVSYYCFMLAGPGIFRLKTNLQDFWTWFAYSRNICSVSTIVPSREPRQCFGMFYYDGYIRSTIKSCDEQKSFVCQYEKVTCGEKFNMSLNGSLVTPGYMGRGYDHYGRCVWTISVPKDHNIQLSMNISIENTYMCRSDFLRVFRGNFSNGISLCGNVTDVLNIASSNVTIEFRSDGTINGKGVYITWEAVPFVSEVTNSITREISTILTPY